MVRFFRKKKNFICLIVQEKLYDLPKKQWETSFILVRRSELPLLAMQ